MRTAPGWRRTGTCCGVKTRARRKFVEAARETMKKWIESQEEMAEILGRAAVGRLGLIADGEPYVVPLNFAYADGRIYFHSGLQGRKIEAIQNNPRACFEVDELQDLVIDQQQSCLSGTRYRSVIAWGIVRRLESDAEKMKALDCLLEKYAAGKPFQLPPQHMLAIVNVYEIQVDKMSAKANVASSRPPAKA
jgi:nitroimidazol reductase NimA-like FMN-containing flavoprotein (pyridoxamine 5'-phosphate oxidase superfamily)